MNQAEWNFDVSESDGYDVDGFARWKQSRQQEREDKAAVTSTPASTRRNRAGAMSFGTIVMLFIGVLSMFKVDRRR